MASWLLPAAGRMDCCHTTCVGHLYLPSLLTRSAPNWASRLPLRLKPPLMVMPATAGGLGEGVKNGDPVGRKQVGREVVKWLSQGMAAMAREMAEAEANGAKARAAEEMEQGGSLVSLSHRFLNLEAMPVGLESRCLQLASHYPTLFDHLQRELQSALLSRQRQGRLADWQCSASWTLLKKLARSDEHRDNTRAHRPVEHIQHRVDALVARARQLLRVEREAQLEADTAPGGEGERRDRMSGLRAVSSSTGLGGVHLLLFRAPPGELLPRTSIAPGDMVRVEAGAGKGLSGCVYSLGQEGGSITVSLQARYGDPACARLFGNAPVRITRISQLADDTTYQRDCDALDRLQKQGVQATNPSRAVVAALFGRAVEASLPAGSQEEGVRLALDVNQPVVVLQGPPGSGKTRVVVEVIRAAVARGERVLATAPSNGGVDNLVERLAEAGLEVVRVGNPCRVAPAVVARSLPTLVHARLEPYRQDMARRRADLRADLRQTAGEQPLGAGIRQLLKQLGKAQRKRERQAVAETLASAEVILCTNTGAADPLLLHHVPTSGYDLVVVDEAGQAMEPSTWIPALQGRRLILAGDPQQLPPVIFSQAALDGGLGVSLLERAAELGLGLGILLSTQYRMNAAIAHWASVLMYQSRLQTAPEVATRVLADGLLVESNASTRTPLLLLDTRSPLGSLLPGCQERLHPGGSGSYYNEGEAEVAVAHVAALLAAGVEAAEIALLSPYLAQMELLQERLEEVDGAAGVEVASVDSFQGREADAVVISMVRSNSLQVVGFLADRRRMNVAVTRARKHLAVVCDSATVGRNAFLRTLLQHIRQFGDVRSASQPNLPGFMFHHPSYNTPIANYPYPIAQVQQSHRDYAH